MLQRDGVVLNGHKEPCVLHDLFVAHLGLFNGVIYLRWLTLRGKMIGGFSDGQQDNSYACLSRTSLKDGKSSWQPAAVIP